jgi:uncharacterized protein
MSEHINNATRRKIALRDILRQLHEGKSVDEVKALFTAAFPDVNPSEITQAEQMLIEEGLPAVEIQDLCDVHTAVFQETLDRQASPETIPGHPVHTFLAENDAASDVLAGLRRAVANLGDHPTALNVQISRTHLEKLMLMERHYLRKENLLFPILERHQFYGPSQVMWGIHNDIRLAWKQLSQELDSGPGTDLAAFAVRVKNIFAPLDEAVSSMIYKEIKILFPAALERLSLSEWAEIHTQEPEIGYCFIKPGDRWHPVTLSTAAIVEPTAEPGDSAPTPSGDLVRLNTGALTSSQIKLLLTNLPVDVTFVDENDEVRFFSETRERIFPRQAAIIGRKVQNCHPPQSIAAVQHILDDFRATRRDTAEFWIQMAGKFIHIRYFAMRDPDGTYRGALEVTQDATGIRSLTGERRLLDD